MGPFSPKSTVSIALVSEVVFLHPRAAARARAEPDAESSADALVKGTVILNLPKRRAVRSVEIVLQGLCDVFGGPQYRYSANQLTLKKELALSLDGEMLEAGDHLFTFNIIVPSTTATFELCQFGRVRHVLRATVEFVGPLGGERKRSAPVALWLRASASAPGEPPEPFDCSFVNESAHLGPVNVTYSSRNLAISSLLHLKLNLLAPSVPLTIIAIDAFINQRFTAHYEEEDRTARPRPRLYRLTRIKRDRSASRPLPPDSPQHSPAPSPGPSTPSALHSSPIPVPHPGEPRQRTLRRPSVAARGSSPGPALPSLHEAEAGATFAHGFELDRASSRDENVEQTWSRGGRQAEVRLGAEEWAYETMFRLPTDETIRPSTLKGTKTALVVTHELVLGIAYRLASAPTASEPEKLYLSRKVEIACCSCLADASLLPAYSDVAPATGFRPHAHSCGCTLSLDDMLDLEGLAVERAGVMPAAESALGLAGFRAMGMEKSAAHSSLMEGHA